MYRKEGRVSQGELNYSISFREERKERGERSGSLATRSPPRRTRQPSITGFALAARGPPGMYTLVG